MRRLRLPILGLALAMALVAGLAPHVTAPARANHVPVRGYIPVAVGTADETTLHYRVTTPDPAVWGPGPYPAVVDYSGYQPAISIYDGLEHRFLSAGYAVVGVNMRGTGCSGGKFDYFEPLQSRDGAEAIEWLATQSWSNGRLGMVGKSYPGITQLFVAAEQPASLKAIVPGHVFGDLYRDVPFPGGIMNVTFSAGWSAGRIAEQFSVGPPYAQSTGDSQCLANQDDHALNPAFNPFVQAAKPVNWWDSDLFHERSPWYFADRIDVPTMLVESWQDEQVGSRATHLLERISSATPTRFVATNGDHGEYYGGAVFDDILRFLDIYLKDAPAEARAAYEAEAPVTINWENSGGGRVPAWTSSYAAWPAPQQRPWTLYLTGSGGLGDAPAGGSASYLYAPEVGSQERGGFSINKEPAASWNDRPAPGTSASFTTAPLGIDRVLLGPASADLWVSSTAADTDFELTLTEVRPDGQEVFVQQGWLRASHRALDPALSTPLRPFQTHLVGDSQALVAGTATPVRIEVFPFGHVFRAGSRLRLTVAAPHVQPDLWGFAALPVPARNTIYTDAAHPSALVLPWLEGETAQAGYPVCGTLRSQPCRPEPPAS